MEWPRRCWKAAQDPPLAGVGEHFVGESARRVLLRDGGARAVFELGRLCLSEPLEDLDELGGFHRDGHGEIFGEWNCSQSRSDAKRRSASCSAVMSSVVMNVV